MQNQSNSLITFDTQLKTALNNRGESAAFVMASANGYTYKSLFSDKDYKLYKPRLTNLVHKVCGSLKIPRLFHNGSQIKYSSVLMLISLSCLATACNFQKNICFKMRGIALININTKECKGGRHL